MYLFLLNDFSKKYLLSSLVSRIMATNDVSALFPHPQLGNVLLHLAKGTSHMWLRLRTSRWILQGGPNLITGFHKSREPFLSQGTPEGWSERCYVFGFEGQGRGPHTNTCESLPRASGKGTQPRQCRTFSPGGPRSDFWPTEEWNNSLVLSSPLSA